MKRIGLHLGIALITFFLGVGAAWVILLISQPSIIAIEPLPLTETIVSSSLEKASTSFSERVKIVFVRSYKNRHGGILAEFNVTNISNEPLDYLGDSSSPNWNRYYSVRRGSELKEPDRTCGTGLMGYALLPGKSVRFEVVAAHEPSRVQVGFEFYVGEEYRRQTIWSDEVYVSE